EPGALLVRQHDERNLTFALLRLIGVVEEHRIIRRQDGAAAIPEDRGHAFVRYDLHDHLGSGHSLTDERMACGTGLDDGVAHGNVLWSPQNGHGVNEPSSLKAERKPAPLDMIGVVQKSFFP